MKYMIDETHFTAGLWQTYGDSNELAVGVSFDGLIIMILIIPHVLGPTYPSLQVLSFTLVGVDDLFLRPKSLFRGCATFQDQQLLMTFACIRPITLDTNDFGDIEYLVCLLPCRVEDGEGRTGTVVDVPTYLGRGQLQRTRVAFGIMTLFTLDTEERKINPASCNNCEFLEMPAGLQLYAPPHHTIPYSVHYTKPTDTDTHTHSSPTRRTATNAAEVLDTREKKKTYISSIPP
ncbi:uncharacterized protein CLUP02_01526 [Colletotrichum lupini]|uniref:Uncharacterized protein n=1 Tax=Colletotrichum lupini TaxID=145971 RepID=A0A9Q8W993_9PEZI|nr:uncharacterized protein CLUP02_01526 [Colletotrichum lupini]UQC74874.1 hypothetical protein CLUP02_01526 [Colletotrichum lupini]